jgi:hypothetical protein
LALTVINPHSSLIATKRPSGEKDTTAGAPPAPGIWPMLVKLIECISVVWDMIGGIVYAAAQWDKLTSVGNAAGGKLGAQEGGTYASISH